MNIIISLVVSFSGQHSLVALPWSLSNCDFSQVSGNLLSILAYFNNAVVRMV